jgi:hypothetical protein
MSLPGKRNAAFQALINAKHEYSEAAILVNKEILYNHALSGY